jgi:hypothetical protein
MSHDVTVTLFNPVQSKVQVGDIVKIRDMCDTYIIACTAWQEFNAINLTTGCRLNELISLEALDRRIDYILPKGSKVLITV